MRDPLLEKPEPASVELKLELAATWNSLLACLETIGAFAVAARLTSDLVARARIVIEELYSNSIKYGYGGECAQCVSVRLLAPHTDESALTLVYEDEGPPFDPTAWQVGQVPAAELLREGEAGLALLFGLAAAVSYERREGRNRLVVVFASPDAGVAPAPS